MKINKKFATASALVASALFASNALAAPSVGGCGVGSKLFAGEGGIAPQVLAVTTNGSTGSQTFGISTGTSGCSQDGVVQTNWRTAMFIDANGTKLAENIAAGQGESLESLMALLGVKNEHRSEFVTVSRRNFAVIYPSETASTAEVLEGLKASLNSSATLAPYASAI